MVEDERDEHAAEDVAATVGRKAERRLRARREGRDAPWFGLGMFGLIGWAVAVPTVAGTLIGLWLDARVPMRFSWTLSLLAAGLALGCWNAWWWVRRESRLDGGRER